MAGTGEADGMSTLTRQQPVARDDHYQTSLAYPGPGASPITGITGAMSWVRADVRHMGDIGAFGIYEPDDQPVIISILRRDAPSPISERPTARTCSLKLSLCLLSMRPELDLGHEARRRARRRGRG
jgi:hypothetical protein